MKSGGRCGCVRWGGYRLTPSEALNATDTQGRAYVVSTTAQFSLPSVPSTPPSLLHSKFCILPTLLRLGLINSDHQRSAYLHVSIE